MFLTESYVENSAEMGYDPIYAMQAMQEATEDWNDICMKMIKLEHTAIMKEDADLLQEGAKEAVTRFKNNVVVLGRKLMEYLERVRVQWSKIQASVSSKFVNTNAVANMQKAMGEANFKGYKIQLPKSWSVAVSYVENAVKATQEITQTIVNTAKDAVKGTDGYKDKGLKSGSYESTDAKIDALLSKYHFEEISEETVSETLTWKHVKDALDFLKKRPIAIKNVETMKKAVTTVMNAQIKDLDQTDRDERPTKRNELVSLQRGFNKIIIAINKGTSTAIKICNAAKDRSKSGISDNAKSQAYKDARTSGKMIYKGNTSAPAAEGAKSESVLDMFG